MVEHYNSCFKPLQDKKAKQKIINVYSKFSRSSRRTKIWQNQKTASTIILFYLGHPHLIHPFKTNFSEIYYELHILLSFPGKESICQCRRCKFDPWVRKIPPEKKWQPTPVFLPGKSHALRPWQTTYSPWDRKGFNMTHVV